MRPPLAKSKILKEIWYFKACIAARSMEKAATACRSARFRFWPLASYWTTAWTPSLTDNSGNTDQYLHRAFDAEEAVLCFFKHWRRKYPVRPGVACHCCTGCIASTIRKFALSFRRDFVPSLTDREPSRSDHLLRPLQATKWMVAARVIKPIASRDQVPV